MLIEQILFLFISVGFFVRILFKTIKKFDLIYVDILALMIIGMLIDCIELIFHLNTNIFIYILKYVIGIFIPITVILLEKDKKYFPSILRIFNANLNFKLKNSKKAKKILQKVLDKDDNNYNAHILLAKVYEYEGGSRKAIDEYVRALDIIPKDYDSYFRVAYLLNDIGQKEDCMQMLESLLKNKPEYTQASILLSDLLIQNEQYKEAQMVLLDGYKFNEVSYDLLYNLGLVATMLNDFPNAKMFYEKAAQINHLTAVGKYNLAQIELIYKNLEEAQKIFLELIEDENLSPDAYCEISKIYIIRNEKELAIKYANMAIELDPKNIVPKIKRDTLFIPIIAKLSMPFNLSIDEEQRDDEKEIDFNTQKELLAKQHLEQTQDITRNLSYNDLEHMSRRNSSRNIESDIDKTYNYSNERNRINYLDESQKNMFSPISIEENNRSNNFTSIDGNGLNKIDNLQKQFDNKDNIEKSIKPNFLNIGDNFKSGSNNLANSINNFSKLNVINSPNTMINTKSLAYDSISQIDDSDSIDIDDETKSDLEDINKQKELQEIKELKEKTRKNKNKDQKECKLSKFSNKEDDDIEYENIYKKIIEFNFNDNIQSDKNIKKENSKLFKKNKIKSENIDNDNDNHLELTNDSNIDDSQNNITSNISQSKGYDLGSYLENYKNNYANKSYIDLIDEFNNKQNDDNEKLNDNKTENSRLKDSKKIEDITSDFVAASEDDITIIASKQFKKKQEENSIYEKDIFTREQNILIEKYLNNIGLKNTSKEEYKQYLYIKKNRRHIREIEQIEKNRI